MPTYVKNIYNRKENTITGAEEISNKQWNQIIWYETIFEKK